MVALLKRNPSSIASAHDGQQRHLLIAPGQDEVNEDDDRPVRRLSVAPRSILEKLLPRASSSRLFSVREQKGIGLRSSGRVARAGRGHQVLHGSVYPGLIGQIAREIGVGAAGYTRAIQR